MNVFEGARRLAVAVAGIGFVGVAIAAFTYTPYIEMHYRLGPKGELEHGVFGCSGAPEHRARILADGIHATAILCGVPEGPDEVTTSDREIERLREITSSSKLSHSKEIFLKATICLIAYWAAVFSLGWIVRGFLGIPLGKDKKYI